jgi:hypothetical protein
MGVVGDNFYPHHLLLIKAVIKILLYLPGACIMNKDTVNRMTYRVRRD